MEGDMNRDWLGGEPGLKALAFVLLLPLIGVNCYLAYAGILLIANPSAWFGILPGLVFLVLGAAGLVTQVVLMSVSRDSPRGAGVTFLLICLAVGVVGALLGMLRDPLATLMLASPVPGALVLIYAGWRQGRALGRSTA
jgi:hypothetical protein